MSSSMWIWRVILPGLGVSTCLFLLRDSLRPESPNSPAPPGASRPASTPGRVVAEGRVVARPGAEVTIGSEQGGTVVAVRRGEKAEVRKGDVLVEFRADDLQLALAEAEARLAEATAEFSYQQGDYRRKVQATTGPTQFVTELYASRRDLEVAQARRKQAEVAVSRAKVALDRVKVISPIDGVVVASYANPGEVKAPGASLALVCDLARLRVEAEVDEFDLPRIALKDAVIVRAEGYGDESWSGTVEEIPDRVAGRTIRPDDPGRPTDSRVLLVKVGLSSPLTLKLGQQVQVEIRPASRPDLRAIQHATSGLSVQTERPKPDK